MSLPLNTTYDDIYDILNDLDTDDDSNGSMIADFIERLAKENDKKDETIKKLKEDELTEESAIEYVYNHTDQYEDWIEGSTIYEELKEENKKLKDENKELKEQNEELYDYEGAITCLGLIDEDEYNKVVAEKKELFKSLRSSIALATELYREMKYALGYGEFDEPDRQNMYDHIKKLHEFRVLTPKEVKEMVDEAIEEVDGVA